MSCANETRKKNVDGSRLGSYYVTIKNATLLVVQQDIKSPSCVFGKLQNELFMYVLKMISHVPRGAKESRNVCVPQAANELSATALDLCLDGACQAHRVPPVRQHFETRFLLSRTAQRLLGCVRNLGLSNGGLLQDLEESSLDRRAIWHEVF